jgi:hypothetical protein
VARAAVVVKVTIEAPRLRLQAPGTAKPAPEKFRLSKLPTRRGARNRAGAGSARAFWAVPAKTATLVAAAIEVDVRDVVYRQAHAVALHSGVKFAADSEAGTHFRWASNQGGRMVIYLVQRQN